MLEIRNMILSSFVLINTDLGICAVWVKVFSIRLILDWTGSWESDFGLTKIYLYPGGGGPTQHNYSLESVVAWQSLVGVGSGTRDCPLPNLHTEQWPWPCHQHQTPLLPAADKPQSYAAFPAVCSCSEEEGRMLVIRLMMTASAGWW